jgi:hypothetical protein
MSRRVVSIIGLVALMLGAGGALVSWRVTGTVFGVGTPDHAPRGARIRVQVLNATTTRGLAQRATTVLRDRGFDVVEIGNNGERLDSTVVLDRSGHPEWAQRVAAAMGGAQVQSRPDSSRYVDITVLIGAAWRPPAEPFHP